VLGPSILAVAAASLASSASFSSWDADVSSSMAWAQGPGVHSRPKFPATAEQQGACSALTIQKTK